MEELVNLIVSNSMSVVIIAYFLYKDYRFNENVLNVLTEVREVLACLKTWHETESK